MHVAIEQDRRRKRFLEPLTDEQRSRVESYSDYAIKIATDFAKPRRLPLEEAISDGLLGLCDASQSFDPTRGVSFKTYLQYRVRGEVMDGFRGRHYGKRMKVAELNGRTYPETKSMDAGWNMYWEHRESGSRPLSTLHNLLVDEESNTEEIQKDMDFQSRMKLIAERLGTPGRAFVEYYANSLTMKRIGAKFGLSESRVSQMISGATKAIREAPQSFGF